MTPPAPLDGYQRRLLVFLSVACFFEGFDIFALTQVLPQIRAEFALTRTGAGLLLSVANVGTALAFFLVRLADRRGRRPILAITIAGYALFTLASGLAPSVAFFAVAQLIARIFLIAEWAIAMVYAAEEFPADRRGLAIGLIQAWSSLGSVVCAGTVPLLLRLPGGWRSVYFVGVLPLLIMAYARRGLRETARFTERAASSRNDRSLFHILGTPWRNRMLLMALAWGLTYVSTQTAISFWKDHAISERGFSEATCGGIITIGALVSLPFVFLAGRLLDRVGRRPGALVIFVVMAIGIAGAYRWEGRVAVTCAFALAVLGINSVLPVLNAFTTELFPTNLRADAFAWSNNLLGRLTYVLAPWTVGAIADHPGFGYRAVVPATVLFPLLALALILLAFPETRGRELEQTAQMAPARAG